MPIQDDGQDRDKISLVIAGRSHSDWSSYRIDSDFLKAADAWQLMLGLPDKAFPPDIVRGAVVRLMCGDDTVLSGRIDRVSRNVARDSLSLSLSGRDDAAILVDCAAPVFSANQITLDEVIERIVRPLGIRNIRIQAQDAPRNDKVTIGLLPVEHSVLNERCPYILVPLGNLSITKGTSTWMPSLPSPASRHEARRARSPLINSPRS